jgi:GT2 family glycosyltransferase
VTERQPVSVVVPAHNAAATLGAQLDALRSQTDAPSFEIIVVNNRSTDATEKVARTVAGGEQRVRVVDAPHACGPSYSRNVGIRAAQSEIVVCCDADDVVAPNWVGALAGALETHPYVGGPLEVDRLNEQWLPAHFGSVEFAHGCNIGIRRSLFLDLGGFDERLHTGEEVDLALRLMARDIKLHFVPEAVVHYRYRTTATETWRQSFSFGRVGPSLEREAQGLADFRRDRGTFRRLLWLGRNLVRLTDRSMRVRWMWLAGGLCGRATGYVRDPRS